MRLVCEVLERAAMSAEARRELPAPIVLEDGGLRAEGALASGVLFRFPIAWLPDMLSIIQEEAGSSRVVSGR